MIDFERYILMILPRSLRRIGIYSLLITLLNQIKEIYISYISWRASQIIRESGSPQTCMLKRIVYDQLGIIIDIEEDIGSPNDFIVKSNTTDVNIERQLYALINAYKLAGRSFTLSNQAVSFVQNWAGYVCEIENVVQTWDGYVCEQILLPVNELNITVDPIEGDSRTRIIVYSYLLPVSVYLNVISEIAGVESIKEIILYEMENMEGQISIAYNLYTQENEVITDVVPVVESDEHYRYVANVSFID